VKGVFELSKEGLPGLLHLCKEQREANDSHALGDPMIAAAAPGDLFVFDRGCSDRNRMLAIGEREAFFLTPRKDQRLRTLEVLWKAPDPEAAAAQSCAQADEGSPEPPAVGAGPAVSAPSSAAAPPGD